MAIQKNGMLSGTVGTVIMYNYNGTPCVRRKPERVKRSKGMKMHALLFGYAVKLSSRLRHYCNGLLPDTKERKMRYRLNSFLLKFFKEAEANYDGNAAGFTTIVGFDFNGQALLKEKMQFQPLIDFSNDEQISIQWPAFIPKKDVAAPKYVDTVQFLIRALCIENDGYRSVLGGTDEKWDIPYDSKQQAPHVMNLALKTHMNCTKYVILGVKYFYMGREMEPDDKWWTVNIIGVK